MALRLIITLTLLATSLSAASAGPILDDILNYMFLDQTTLITPQGELFQVGDAMSLVKDKPLGQTFITGTDTERIVRIRGWIGPDADWQKGEGAELVLWDSPAKKTALGRYTVWYEFRGYQYNRVEWEVNARVNPNTTYYFEISYVGSGDGKLSRVGLNRNSKKDYEPGQAYVAGEPKEFDLSFQTHVKRPMDRIGDLKKAFARFKLNMPELAEVKAAVDTEDFEAAQVRLVAYFENREKPVRAIDNSFVADYKPEYDTTEGDLAMHNYFQSSEMGKGYAGPDLNWRAEPDFNADGAIAGSGWNTGLNRFGPRGPLTKAYLGTGNHKYVRKLNDVLIDFYLDNPPPEVSKLGGDGSDPVWATLDAGIRLDANFTAYARIRTSPEFTLDGRMAYLLNMADNADTLILNGGIDGGNWSFLPNSALFQFGVNYPEYTNAELWRDTAADRLVKTIKKDIHPDGVEMEAAPGYQRMGYGPLANVYQMILERGLQTSLNAEIKSVLERQAEYFMYLAMPSGITPFLGDWGHTQERDPLKDDSKMFGRQDMLYVSTAGKEGTKPKELSKLYPYFGAVTMRSDWGDTGQPYEDARYLFMHAVMDGSHGHRDRNGITCYAYGRELLSDPGSYTYETPEHALLCKTVSHNVVMIDGQEHDWRCKGGLRNWATTPVADYVSAWANVCKAGDHNRETFYIRANGDPGAQDYYVVRDTVEGSGTHEIQQRWQFELGDLAVDPKSLSAHTMWEDGGNLAIMQVQSSRLKVEQTTTDLWRPREGDPKKMPTLLYNTSGTFPVAFETLLLPYKGKQMPDLQVKSIEQTADGMTSAFKVIQGKVEDLFLMQRASGTKTLKPEKLSFDGDKLFVRKVDGKVRSAMLVNGTSLTIGGKQIIKSAKPVSWVAVHYDATDGKAYASSFEPSLVVSNEKGRKLPVADAKSDDLIKDVRVP